MIRLMSDREPKCARGPNHGNRVNVRGHRKCTCGKCKRAESHFKRMIKLIEQRKNVMAEHAALRRCQQMYTYENATTSTYVPEYVNKCVQTLSYWSIDVSKGSLSKDLANLFGKDQKHDVELKCKEQYSVMAHKIVLCMRSEVFKEMLKGDMQEGRTGVVEMLQFDVHFVLYFVRYLYTDELLNLTFDLAKILYEIGYMFRVKSLMQRCSEYFQENFSLENFCQWLRFAEARSDQKLSEAIKLYMFENRFIAKPGFYQRLSVNQNDPITVQAVRSMIKEHIHNFTETKAHKYVQTESSWNVDGSSGSLSKDLCNLLDTGVNHDVQIRCGDHSIMVHKIIVCARSNVLKTKLQSTDTTGVVEINGIDVCYVKDFVRYLYTDALPELTDESAKILCEIGRIYDVRSLVHRCSEYLKDNNPAEIAPSAAKGFGLEKPESFLEEMIKRRSAEPVIIVTDSDSDSDSDYF